MNLPAPDLTIHCACCGADIADEAGPAQCDDCGLYYPSPQSTAQFVDPAATPCGKPYPDKYGPNPSVTRSAFGDGLGGVKKWHLLTTTMAPCGLPVGHKSVHYYPASSESSYEYPAGR